MAATTQKSSSPEPAYRALARHWRILISVVLLLHLTAVFAAPWAGPDGASPVAREVVRPFEPYLNAAYLGHGYRFFAPEPGPSHLIRYRLEMVDGTTKEGTFPDLETHWPRLLYHRHFMLTEKLDGFRMRGELPPEAPAEVRQEWDEAKKVFNVIARSYAEHLLSSSGGKKVTLELIEHNLPTPARVAEGQKLNDPQLYQVVWTGTFEADRS